MLQNRLEIIWLLLKLRPLIWTNHGTRLPAILAKEKWSDKEMVLRETCNIFNITLYTTAKHATRILNMLFTGMTVYKD